MNRQSGDQWPRVTSARGVASVAVTSNKSLMGGFFSSSSIAINAGGSLHELEFRGQDKAHHMHNLILWHMTK